jgi:2-phospho-L-lactate transferase/gluconeogenesis factor (CofD/UPF0052 family)
VILIDNLAQEVGPAGKMNLTDKINWLNTNIPQLTISKILVDDTKSVNGLPAELIYQTDLTDDHENSHHCEFKLRAALESIFIQLS